MNKLNFASIWDSGALNILRRLVILAAIGIPAYFAGEAWGGPGFIGCIIGEFILFLAALKLIQKVQTRRNNKRAIKTMSHKTNDAQIPKQTISRN